eukprot:2490325-Amphidinium_carterae.1
MADVFGSGRPAWSSDYLEEPIPCKVFSPQSCRRVADVQQVGRKQAPASRLVRRKPTWRTWAQTGHAVRDGAIQRK